MELLKGGASYGIPGNTAVVGAIYPPTVANACVSRQYIGEMETRFIKETEMFFWQFRGQRRPIGIFHGGTFLTAFKMRSIWCILFLNRIGPSQDIINRHSPHKIQEVVPGFRS